MNFKDVVGITWMCFAYSVAFIPDTEVAGELRRLIRVLTEQFLAITLCGIGQFHHNTPIGIKLIERRRKGHLASGKLYPLKRYANVQLTIVAAAQSSMSFTRCSPPVHS